MDRQRETERIYVSLPGNVKKLRYKYTIQLQSISLKRIKKGLYSLKMF